MKLRAAFVTVLVIAAAAAAAAPAAALTPAGTGWFWQSPQPQGNELNDVAFGDAASVWAVGNGGTILHSSDAGLTWQPQASGTTESLASVDFVDASHGWAVGGQNWAEDDFTVPGATFTGVILATTDGGVTWTSQSELDDKAVADVAFVNDKEGWAVGTRGLIVHTTDGGAAWTGQTSGVASNLMSVAFVDALHGYAGGAEGTILATSDGGATWTRLRTAEKSLDWTAVSSLAVDGNGTVWAGLGSRSMTGDFPRLARSSDGGRHWRAAGVGRVFDVWRVVASGQRIVAVGPQEDSAAGALPGGPSRVLVSNDGGATWSSHIVGAAVTLGGVALGAGDAACAVGNVIATSADGGATWYGRSTRALAVGNIDVVGPTEAWATGGSNAFGWLLPFLFGGSGADPGTVLHTADGVRWDTQLSDPRHYLVGVDFADASNGWAVGSGGVIQHTADGGASWATQPSGSKGFLDQVAASSATSAWVLGFELTKRVETVALLHTVDGGTTWTRAILPKTDYPLAMSWVSPNEGWLAASSHVGRTYTRIVLHTTDAGATWTEQSLGGLLGTSAVPLAVDFVDGQHGWLAAIDTRSGHAAILATSDGGASWHVAADQTAFGGDLITSVDFIGASEGWASGAAVYHTTDGGATWTRQVSGLDQMVSVAAYDATHVWAGGSGGILSTVDTAADTAPPITLCDAAGGWTRTTVAPHLTAADVGSAGLAGTEYRVDGGPWTPGLTPPVFAAPADHSGDGSHEVEYRSTDKAGNVEPEQRLRVKIDTIRPVIRLGRCVIGRDGVLRIRVRIDDRSCPSISDFEINITSRQFGPSYGGYEGFRIPTNRWFTFRDSHGDNGFPVGTYPLTFYAKDRAGNAPVRIGRGLLVVKPHKSHLGSSRVPGARGPAVLRRADGPAPRRGDGAGCFCCRPEQPAPATRRAGPAPRARRVLRAGPADAAPPARRQEPAGPADEAPSARSPFVRFTLGVEGARARP